MFRHVLLAAALAVATTGAARAATLDFTFSFVNSANGGGTVTGIVRGLTDNATGPASSVEVLTNTAGFGIGEYVGNPFPNSFTVTAGSITTANFVSFGITNTAPAVTTASLDLRSLSAGLSNSARGVSVSATTVTFTPVDVAPIPVPAALPLLLGGMGAIAIAGRRRARRAAAA